MRQNSLMMNDILGTQRSVGSHSKRGHKDSFVELRLNLYVDVGGHWVGRAAAALRLQLGRAPTRTADVAFWHLLLGNVAATYHDNLSHHWV